MEKKNWAENKRKPDKFGFALTSLEILIRIAESNKGIRAGLGDGEAAMKAAQRARIDIFNSFHCNITKPHSNPAVLTPEGYELARITKEFLAALEEFKRKCQNLSPKITIAAGDSIVNWIVLPVVKSLFSEQSKILFSVRQGGTKGLIELLDQSQTDFIIVPEKTPLKVGWKFEILGSYEYSICCPKSLLKGKPLNDAVLPYLNFAMITKHWGLDFIKNAQDAGITLNAKILCETFSQVARLVKLNLFAGILPRSVMPSLADESHEWHRPGFMKGTERTLKLVWKPVRTHIKSCVDEVAKSLLEQLRHELAKNNLPSQ